MVGCCAVVWSMSGWFTAIRGWCRPSRADEPDTVLKDHPLKTGVSLKVFVFGAYTRFLGSAPRPGHFPIISQSVNLIYDFGGGKFVIYPYLCSAIGTVFIPISLPFFRHMDRCKAERNDPTSIS